MTAILTEKQYQEGQERFSGMTYFSDYTAADTEDSTMDALARFASRANISAFGDKDSDNLKMAYNLQAIEENAVLVRLGVTENLKTYKYDTNPNAS